MLSNKNNENNSFWKSTWERIARMEAELQAHKDFIQFMAEESAADQAALTSEAEEAEAITN